MDPRPDKVTAEHELRASGNSTVLSFPPPLLEAVRLEQGDRVTIAADPSTGVLTVTDVDVDGADGTEGANDA
jgi:antitoxin component of MazEF toxin-antitoxin module